MGGLSFLPQGGLCISSIPSSREPSAPLKADSEEHNQLFLHWGIHQSLESFIASGRRSHPSPTLSSLQSLPHNPSLIWIPFPLQSLLSTLVWVSLNSIKLWTLFVWYWLFGFCFVFLMDSQYVGLSSRSFCLSLLSPRLMNICQHMTKLCTYLSMCPRYSIHFHSHKLLLLFKPCSPCGILRH